MAYPRFLIARRHKFIVKNTADYALTSTTWANLDTSTDLSLEAQVGDVLKAFVNGEVDNGAVYTYFNVCTIVAATPVNFFGSGEPTTTTGDGVAGWFCDGGGRYGTTGSSAKRYTVQAGDIAAGIVTCRLRYRVSAATRILHASVTVPFEFAIENIGPVDPT